MTGRSEKCQFPSARCPVLEPDIAEVLGKQLLQQFPPAHNAINLNCNIPLAQIAAFTILDKFLKSDQYLKLESALGINLDSKLLTDALTHRSFANEFKLSNPKADPVNHFERLEFLGDSVLGLIITEELFNKFPEFEEGELSPLRSGVVNSKALANISRKIGVGPYLRIGRGEEVTGGRDKNSILADCCEAIFGAIYLEHGFEKTRAVVLKHFQEVIEQAVKLGAGIDSKTALQDLCATRNWPTPIYRISESGPDHDKSFSAVVIVNNQEYPSGHGKSKREAEQVAARAAYLSLL